MDACPAADSDRELAFLRAVIDHAHAGIVATDATGAIVLWNRVFERYHGRRGRGERGRVARALRQHRERRRHAELGRDDAPIARLLRGEIVSGLEHAVICADGELRHRRAWGETIVGEDGELRGAVLAFHDVTQQRQAEDALRHQALHDGLTGLPNRTLLLDGLRTSIGRARRTKRLIAACMIDLDRFKLVNETLGHLEGDLVLVAVARRLTGAVRPGDTVARVGSDEFAIVCDEVEDEARGDAARRRAARRARPAALDPGPRGAPHRQRGRRARARGRATAEALLRMRTPRCTPPRRGGRDRSTLFDASLHERAMRRLETERALVRAIAGHAIEARFQPVVVERAAEPSSAPRRSPACATRSWG